MRLLKLGTAVIVVAAALAPAALADQPTTTITQIDRTRTLPAGPDACAFPFVIHTTGTYRETVYSSGRDVTHAVDFHIQYTNPANGKTLETALAGPFVVEPNDDGTVTVTINGNNANFTAPGEGPVFSNVGKLVYIASADDVFTPLQLLKSTGRQDSDFFTPICGALG